jgi:hypothetical protein
LATELPISASAFSALPPPLRTKAHLGLADQARRAAAASKGEIHDAFIAIAEQWKQLVSAAAKSGD